MPPTKLGTLVVVVLKARNLPNPSLYKQSPYILARLDGSGKRTKVDVKGGQHPVWDEDLHFEIHAQNRDEPHALRLTCFVEGRKRVDESIGEGELQIDDVLRRGEFDGWVPLSLNGKQRGEVYLELTFFVNAQALGRRPSKLSPAERVYRPSPPPSPRGSSPRPSSSQSNNSDSGNTPLSLPGAYPANTAPLNLPPRQEPALVPGTGSTGLYPSSPPRTPLSSQHQHYSVNNTQSPPVPSSYLPPSPNPLRPPSDYGLAYYDPYLIAATSATAVSTVPPSLRPGSPARSQAAPAPTPTLVATLAFRPTDPPPYTPTLPPKRSQQHLESQRLALEERDRRRRQEEEDEVLARQLMLEEEENERRERSRARQTNPDSRTHPAGRSLPGGWNDE